ncbi:MAG: DNA polymerase I [Clostridia bacterium]
MKLVLVDGNSIINRAYFALPVLNDNLGRNVNAVYGFMSIIIKMLADYKPTNLVVAFDERGKTARHLVYEQYKANRKGMPDDLAMQMPILKELLKLMGIKTLSMLGVEADDIIGTLAKRFKVETLLLSGDRDLFQLIDDNITCLLTKKGISEVEQVNQTFLLENYKLTPKQVIEFKALRGDSADNIPGVAGVGDKTAMSLLEKYSSVDNVYNDIDNITGSLKTRLIDGKELCYISRGLATIDTNVNIDCKLEDSQFSYTFSEEAKKMFEALQFNSLIKRIDFDKETAISQKQIVEVKNINTLDELKNVIKYINGQKELSIYFGQNISLATNQQTEYVINIADTLLCEGINYNSALEALKGLIEGTIPKTVFGGKAINTTLAEYDTKLNNVVYDLDLMQYLTEYRSYKIQAFFEHYSITNFASGQLFIKDLLLSQLAKDNLLDLYNNVELPLSNVLFDMEQQGVAINLQALDELGKQYNQEIASLTKQVYELTGQEFNIASPKQLGEVLFVKLGLPSGKKTKTKSGFSTENEVLEGLLDVHPAIELIIKIRQLSKLNGTYIEGLKAHINRGIIRTTYNQTLTTTGRLSSSEPNLQNLPIRNEQGIEIRKLFVPKYDCLISADYSQIELRLLASFSGDQIMISAFNDGEDIHRKVASEIFKVDKALVTDKMRRMAKAVNFGIIYGISDYGLAENTGIPFYRAKEYIKTYFETYPKIKEYLDSSVEKAQKEGYVTTILGRRRQIPEINSANFQLKNFGKRAAMNMPLQGSSADIIKLAMIKVHSELTARRLKSKLILQIHDELIIDCYNDEKEIVKEILVRQMENAVSLPVKLVTDVAEGSNLYEAK